MTGDHEHVEGHGHGHEHVGSHRHEAGQGPVVIDVGGGTGALVLRTAPELVGAEIDITPVADDHRRRHVAVHTRPVPGHVPVHAAVYDGLDAGRYRLWWPPGTVAGEVEVPADGVLEVDWDDLVGASDGSSTACGPLGRLGPEPFSDSAVRATR